MDLERLRAKHGVSNNIAGLRTRGRPPKTEAEKREAARRRRALGVLLRKLRADAGYDTVREAANASQVISDRRLSQFESGRVVSPNGDSVFALAAIYGLTPRELALKVIRVSDPILAEALNHDTPIDIDEALAVTSAISVKETA